MAVIMKEEHLQIIAKVRRKALQTHLWGIALVACILLVFGFHNWIVELEARIVRESYAVFKGQFNSLLARQQLYTLLRSKSLTVGQAMDVADAIMSQDRVPVHIALAMISVESDFNPDAISSAGAKGLTQVMPVVRRAYANQFGGEIKQVYNVSVNVKLGLMYLGDLYEQFKDWRVALRAYNAGPENAYNKKYDGYATSVLKKSKGFKS